MKAKDQLDKAGDEDKGTAEQRDVSVYNANKPIGMKENHHKESLGLFCSSLCCLPALD